ncbi:protein of unknown function [Streptomyces murinus]
MFSQRRYRALTTRTGEASLPDSREHLAPHPKERLGWGRSMAARGRSSAYSALHGPSRATLPRSSPSPPLLR